MMFPWIPLIALSLTTAALLWKVRRVRRSLKTLAGDLTALLDTDTNILLSAPSRDPEVLALTAALDRELRRLRDARRRYELGDRELMDALANVSHDLRTPLTAISGYAQLLTREELSPGARGCVEAILSRADAMGRLTEELFRGVLLLDRGPGVPSRCDVRALLEECLAGAYGELTERGIVPTVSLPPSPLWRELDREALSRVFQNLLSNAARHGAGPLTVSLTPDGTVLFRNPAPDLTPADASRLFDRFYSPHHSTGLGLSIAQSLATQMHAPLTAQVSNGHLTLTLKL